MNDTTRDDLERRIADIIHYEICGYIPSTDPILYLEGNDHSNQVESVTREVIREIVAARDAETRAVSEPDADAGDDLDADMTLAYMKGWQDGQDAAGDAPGLDERIIRLEAQVRYLRGYAISLRGELMTAMNGGNVPTVEQTRRIIDGIDGNTEVAGHEAVKRAKEQE